MSAQDFDYTGLGIPVRDERRGTIIGFCHRAPYDGGLQLAIYRPNAGDMMEHDGDVSAVPDVVRVDMTYDAARKCYWAFGYDCLLSDWITPY